MDERAAVRNARDKVNHWDAALRDAIVTAYKAGAVTGMRDLATLSGWAPERVRQLLISRGVKLQGRGRRKEDGAQQ